jgi:formylglycine-generating enzyme required for sulfatase activity/tRNA A-37 threonylcarbamoyl transferase component Bud32
MNAREFLRAALDSGIISPDFATSHAAASAATDKEDARSISDSLVASGRLTAYQAREIGSGRAAGLVLGPYVLLDLVGSGGMGAVYRAEHRTMRRIVALKVIKGHRLSNADSVQRFTREVQASARLEHPNIVTAFDAGEASGTHYLVMQFVEGRTLADVVKEHGPQPVGRVLDWILQAARGLGFAHGQGVIHRDIKPGNLIVDSRGIVKILDLGLARLDTLDAHADPITSTGQIIGTIDFIAPEQATDTRLADARSDVYSLGATLWYLLAGRPLFDGETALGKIMAHMQTPAPALNTVRSDVRREVEAVFQRMVAKRPADRFQSMQELIAALESLPQDERRAGAPGVAGGGGAAFQRSPSHRPAVVGPSPIRLAIAGGTIGTLAVASMVLFAFPGGREVKPTGGGEEPAVGSTPQPGGDLPKKPQSPGSSPRAPSSGAPPHAMAPFDTTQARRHQEAWARHLGIEVETINSIGLTLVIIPPGRFTMGEGNKTVEVTLTKPFLLGQTEVTRRQWRDVMNTDPCMGKLYVIDDDDAAVTYVTWHDAASFCERLTERERANGRITTSQAYRLPSRAASEWACRAGTVGKFSFGDDDLLLERHAWYGNGWDASAQLPIPGGNTTDAHHAHPVQLKQPNPWRLFDVHGNVLEWIDDRDDAAIEAARARPQTLPDDAVAICRGGSWLLGKPQCHSAFWKHFDASNVSGDLGFRIALSLGDEGPPEHAEQR